jgi:hypothetical protein
MAGGAEIPNIAAPPAIARLGADRKAPYNTAVPAQIFSQQLLFKGMNRRGVPAPIGTLLIQFAVEEVLSGAVRNAG